MGASREDVWLALSELWLDSEPGPVGLAHIVRVLRASGLSRQELQHIFHCEVAPAVWLNAWSAAGVWSGFAPQWLFAECRRNQARGRLHRCRCRLLRRPMTYACRAEWRAILAQLDNPEERQ